MPELYTEQEMDAVEKYIEAYYGTPENVMHELFSPDIHVDICIIPPTKDRKYYTLVTMGMGAHKMNVPKKLAEYKLERAELMIALPADWELGAKEEKWWWPIRLLKMLARLPGECGTWLGWGHTIDNQEPFAEDTDLCASILVSPQGIKDEVEICLLPNGEEVNFYQVIPLYREEMEYKQMNDADALLEEMAFVDFVVNPQRPSAMDSEGIDYSKWIMDMASLHIESIQEKNLPVEELTAFNHLAIYLRWCIEHDLMNEKFMEDYGEIVQRVKEDAVHTDLRSFIRDELEGMLIYPFFNEEGREFAYYYYADGNDVYFPSDIDDYALAYFGEERYHSDEFQDEAYLFVPFDEEYYQNMAKVIDRRWAEADKTDNEKLE